MSAPAVRPGDEDPAMRAAAARALDFIADGALVGLGSGRTASAFVRLLGARVRDGLRVTGVPASAATAALARESGIPLVPLTEDVLLDITVDGADEVAPNLDLIKGHGGALVRERIIAAASRMQVIVVDEGKLVRLLGERFALPVEVIPFAAGPATRAIKAAGLHPRVRMDATTGVEFVNENGNITLDCAFAAPLADAHAARALEAQLHAIPGVVDTGLFLGTAERVLVGHADGRVTTMVRGGAAK
jgi:ribose 5-phosphate isomerase A